MQQPKIFYGWYIVAACLVLIILDGLLLYSFGVLLPSINSKFNLTEASGASIFALRSFVLAFSLPVSGKLVDKYDPRLVIFSGGLICVLGMFLSAFANTPLEFFIFFGVIIGLGDGVLYITCVALISRWFVKKRSLAIGIITTGVPLSGLFIPPLTTWLIINFGFENALLSLSGIIMAAIFSSFILKGNPRDMNLQPYGHTGFQHTTDNTVIDSKENEYEWNAKEAIFTPNFFLLYFLHLSGFIAFLIVITHLFNYEITIGIPEMLASGAPAAIGLGSICGRILLSSLLAEHLKRERILFLCYIAQGSSILILLLTTNVKAYYLFGFLFGFFYSGWIPIYPMLLGNFFGLKALGTIYGFFSTSFSLAALIGPILAGYIFGVTGSYSNSFILAIACCYLASILTFFIRKPESKNK
jgi:MFS family permease